MILRLVILVVVAASACLGMTPDEWLAAQRKPYFNQTNTLPLLSKFSWQFSLALNKELADNWNYALVVDENLTEGRLATKLADTNSDTWKVLNLATSNPSAYKLQVYIDRLAYLTNLVSRGFWVTNASGEFVDQNTNTWTNVYATSPIKVVSPEADDSDISLQTAALIEPLTNILAMGADIAIVMNGGERDLGVVGFNKNAMKQDARVLLSEVITNAYNSSTNPTGLSWPRYISAQKARALSNLTVAVQAAVPNRQQYVWYFSVYEKSRFNQPGYNWEDDWANWGWMSQYIMPALEIPTTEDYYTGLSSYTNATGTAWNNTTEMLMKHLNGQAFQLTIGYPLHYGFVCGGWSNTDTNRFSDITRYKGFLKCLYASGMYSACAGYFEYPSGASNSIFGSDGFTGSFSQDYPPHWLQQHAALSQVHSTFTHLESWLRDADLLQGDQTNFVSRDLPMYEFTNTVADTTARVLVRKKKTSNDWLIAAWAAYGDARDVTVNIPTLGATTVNVSPGGSLYLANTNGLTLLGVVSDPASLTATKDGTDTDLAWTSSDPVFRIYQVDAGVETFLGETTNTTYTATGADRRDFRVTAIDNYGYESQGADVSFYVKSARANSATVGTITGP